MPTAVSLDRDELPPRPPEVVGSPRPDVTDDLTPRDLADLWLDLGGGD
jgi:hypothetical protein